MGITKADQDEDNAVQHCVHGRLVVALVVDGLILRKVDKVASYNVNNHQKVDDRILEHLVSFVLLSCSIHLLH
jgi:hypothetical protein